MAVTIGPKIGVEGEADYREQMGRVISKTNALKAEMIALKTAVTDEATAEENARLIAANHEEQIKTQEERVKLLTEQLEKCKAQTGENSTETNKYREQLANAQTTLNQLRNETDQGTDAMEDFADAEEEAGDGALSLGDLISANLISEAIISGLKKLAQLAWDAAKGLVNCANDAAQYADDVRTAATVTGLTTDQIQEFSYMADLVDVSFNTMTGSMTKLTKTMQNARKGNKEAAESFQKLGVRTTNADGSLRDSQSVFFDVIDALGRMEEGTERDALAMEIFGRSAQELNPLIAAGSGAIEQFRREAHQMGYVLDDETLESLGALSDAYAHLNNLRTTIRNRLGAAMAPAMERVLNKLVEFSERIDWERLGEKLGGAIEVGADKLIALLEDIDLDAAAQGAMTLVEALISGLGWILDHADEIVALIKDIGIGLLVGKGVNTATSAAGMFKNFFSGWGSKAGGTAAAGTAKTALSGAGTAAGGVGLAAMAPLLSVFAGVGLGAYMGKKSIDEAEALGKLGGGHSTADYQQNVANWEAQVQAARENIKILSDAGADLTMANDALTNAQFSLWSAVAEMLGTDNETGGKIYNAWKAVEEAQAKLDELQESGASQRKIDKAKKTLEDAQGKLDTLVEENQVDISPLFDTSGLEALPVKAAGWGSDMMTSFADGMSAGFNSSVLPTALTIAAGLAGLFAHSEPTEGPLSDDSTWMPDMMASFAAGIRANRGLVLDEMNALASDMAGSMGGAGGTTMNYGGVTVVFQVQDGQDGRALFDQFSDWLAQSVYREGASFA